mgnify:CR=1 FL=1
MASPNKQKLTTGSRKGVSAGTSEMLQQISTSSFTKDLTKGILNKEGSPWDKIFNDLGTNSRQHTKELSMEFGRHMEKNPSLAYEVEKMPYAIQNVASDWAENMSAEYERNASIAASLKDNTSSDGYKEAIKNMSDINQAFVNLDADLTGFLKYRDDGEKLGYTEFMNQFPGHYTDEFAATYTAFMNKESLGKDGIFDDIFSISSDGRVSYELGYDELGKDGKTKTGTTLYREPKLLSDLKQPGVVDQTKKGLGYFNSLDNLMSTNTDFSSSIFGEIDSDGESYNDNKWRALQTTPEMYIDNYIHASTQEDLLSTLFNFSYSGNLYDNNGQIRTLDENHMTSKTMWTTGGGEGDIFDTQEGCLEAHDNKYANCYDFNQREMGGKIAHYGGNKKLVVDKYIHSLRTQNSNWSGSVNNLANGMGMSREEKLALGKLTPTQQLEFIRNKMKEGHFLDVNGEYTADITKSGVVAFFQKDFSQYLWYKRASLGDKVGNTAGDAEGYETINVEEYLSDKPVN